MIDRDELLNAGFTESQAGVLMRAFEVLDRTSAQRFEALQKAVNEGFAEVREQMRAGFERMEHNFQLLDQRLSLIETHMQEPGPNGGAE